LIDIYQAGIAEIIDDAGNAFSLLEDFFDDPYLAANFELDGWKFWVPQKIRLLKIFSDGSNYPCWQFAHKYGTIELLPLPRLSIAGKESQPYQVLTQREKLQKNDEVFIIGAKLKALVKFKRTMFRKQSHEFHLWATGFITQLQEFLDFHRYLENRRDKIISDFDWKIGYMLKQESIWQGLNEIKKSLNEIK